MSKKKTPKPKIKTKIIFQTRRLSQLAGTLLIFLIVIVGFIIIYSVWHEDRERGQLNVTDVYLGENLNHSLDLKLASKAAYPSSPITDVKNLDTTPGSVQKQIFSFDVKTDHLVEYGLLVTPSGTQPKNGWPTIILLHGYSNPANYSTLSGYMSDINFYAQHGFAVVKPDYRGQGMSANQGQADSAYYSMSYNTDVMSLISALQQTKFINPNNINLWGHSMGAYIALRVATINPDIKNVILLAGPVDSLKEMYVSFIPPSEINDPYALARRDEVFAKYGTPDNNSRFWYDASPSNFLSQVKANIQIHVGLSDTVVPPKFSADLDSALTQLNLKHQYYTYSDADHSLESQRNQIWQRSLQALDNS